MRFLVSNNAFFETIKNASKFTNDAIWFYPTGENKLCILAEEGIEEIKYLLAIEISVENFDFTIDECYSVTTKGLLAYLKANRLSGEIDITFNCATLTHINKTTASEVEVELLNSNAIMSITDTGFKKAFFECKRRPPMQQEMSMHWNISARVQKNELLHAVNSVKRYIRANTLNSLRFINFEKQGEDIALTTCNGRVYCQSKLTATSWFGDTLNINVSPRIFGFLDKGDAEVDIGATEEYFFLKEGGKFFRASVDSSKFPHVAADLSKEPDLCLPNKKELQNAVEIAKAFTTSEILMPVSLTSSYNNQLNITGYNRKGGLSVDVEASSVEKEKTITVDVAYLQKILAPIEKSEELHMYLGEPEIHSDSDVLKLLVIKTTDCVYLLAPLSSEAMDEREWKQSINQEFAIKLLLEMVENALFRMKGHTAVLLKYEQGFLSLFYSVDEMQVKETLPYVLPWGDNFEIVTTSGWLESHLTFNEDIPDLTIKMSRQQESVCLMRNGKTYSVTEYLDLDNMQVFEPEQFPCAPCHMEFNFKYFHSFAISRAFALDNEPQTVQGMGVKLDGYGKTLVLTVYHPKIVDLRYIILSNRLSDKIDIIIPLTLIQTIGDIPNGTVKIYPDEYNEQVMIEVDSVNTKSWFKTDLIRATYPICDGFLLETPHDSAEIESYILAGNIVSKKGFYLKDYYLSCDPDKISYCDRSVILNWLETVKMQTIRMSNIKNAVLKLETIDPTTTIGFLPINYASNAEATKFANTDGTTCIVQLTHQKEKDQAKLSEFLHLQNSREELGKHAESVLSFQLATDAVDKAEEAICEIEELIERTGEELESQSLDYYYSKEDDEEEYQEDGGDEGDDGNEEDEEDDLETRIQELRDELEGLHLTLHELRYLADECESYRQEFRYEEDDDGCITKIPIGKPSQIYYLQASQEVLSRTLQFLVDRGTISDSKKWRTVAEISIEIESQE